MTDKEEINRARALFADEELWVLAVWDHDAYDYWHISIHCTQNAARQALYELVRMEWFHMKKEPPLPDDIGEALAIAFDPGEGGFNATWTIDCVKVQP